MMLVGVVLPFCGVLSLFKSWKEAKQDGNEPARVATLRMLISQMGGGLLAVLVLPLLHLIGIGSPWSTAIATLAYAFALLMPLAFAAAVRGGLLNTSAE
jgi:Na+/melibiose symporter-like transporter